MKKVPRIIIYLDGGLVDGWKTEGLNKRIRVDVIDYDKDVLDMDKEDLCNCKDHPDTHYHRKDI